MTGQWKPDMDRVLRQIRSLNHSRSDRALPPPVPAQLDADLYRVTNLQQAMDFRRELQRANRKVKLLTYENERLRALTESIPPAEHDDDGKTDIEYATNDLVLSDVSENISDQIVSLASQLNRVHDIVTPPRRPRARAHVARDTSLDLYASNMADPTRMVDEAMVQRDFDAQSAHRRGEDYVHPTVHQVVLPASVEQFQHEKVTSLIDRLVDAKQALKDEKKRKKSTSTKKKQTKRARSTENAKRTNRASKRNKKTHVSSSDDSSNDQSSDDQSPSDDSDEELVSSM